jgi:hypothetical protein
MRRLRPPAHPLSQSKHLPILLFCFLMPPWEPNDTRSKRSVVPLVTRLQKKRNKQKYYIPVLLVWARNKTARVMINIPARGMMSYHKYGRNRASNKDLDHSSALNLRYRHRARRKAEISEPDLFHVLHSQTQEIVTADLALSDALYHLKSSFWRGSYYSFKLKLVGITHGISQTKFLGYWGFYPKLPSVQQRSRTKR